MVLTSVIAFLFIQCHLQGWGLPMVNGNPTFASDRLQLTYTLIEEQAAGIVLGNVKEAFLRGKSYDQDTLSRLGFAFLRSEGHHLEYFEIEEDTGILKTSGVLDRELLCGSDSNGECELEFEVAVRPVPVRYLEVVVITVFIQDINDNQPRFLKDTHTVNVSETALPGATFILPMAQDLDSKKFSIQNYLLADPPPEFSLQVSSNGGLPSDVRLALRRKLDREAEPFYALNLIAVDGGTPPLSGTLTVNVQVLDANDNNPIFDEDSYNGKVREDAEIGNVVIQVHATDSDEGHSGTVLYSLVTDGGVPQNLPFIIEEESGEISVSGPLDFEDTDTYTLTVSAKDKGPSAVPTNTRVVINIIDVNDHAPRIIVNSLTSSGKVEVPENAEQGQFVAHLTVEDIDAGQNGLVTCTTENEHFDVEMMYTNEYKVITKKPCDRETSDTVNVMVTCTDNSEDPLQSETEIEIHVLDQNDKAPQFILPVYSVTVQENNAIGIPLLTVNATDQDIGKNAEISYAVDEDGKDLIAVDPKTGILRTSAVFDHEKFKHLEFHIIALDGGSPKLSSSATVVLKILDTNDEHPVFPKQTYNFATFENQPAGTEIGTVSANDADDPPYDTVNYMMQASEDVADAFKVELDTGKIVAKRVLDRESKPMYTMSIIASNPGTSHPSATTSVTIYIADVNDNPPVFTFPNVENSSVTIPSNAPPGFIVTRLEAIDADFSQNAKLIFAIVQDDWGIFVVDTHTGIVSIGKHWKHLDGDYFSITVSVTDRGNSALSTTTDLHIIVNKTLVAPVTSGKLHQSSSTVITGQQLILLLSAISLLLIIVLVIAVVVVKRQLYNRKREERGRYAYRVDLTPTPSATLPDIQFTEANDSGSDPANSEFTPIDNFRNDRALSSTASAGATAGGTDLHNLSHDASSSQQSTTDDSRDYGTWDRQMVTEVALEPRRDTKSPVPSQYPNLKSAAYPPQHAPGNIYVPCPSPNQFLGQKVPGSAQYQNGSEPLGIPHGSSIRPQLIDTSALLHHLNWLQNNPNSQMVPMVQLQPCFSESSEDTDSSSSGTLSSDKGESSTSSVCSADMSFSDSGRGTSEDDCHVLAMAALNNGPLNGTTYEQLHVPGKPLLQRQHPRKCSRPGPQTPAMYTSLQPVQPNQPKHNYYANVPQYMPVAPPRGHNGKKRQESPQHQKNCPCCKVKLLSTIHGQPCGSNARPYSPSSRPTSPEVANAPGVDTNRSRPMTPVSESNMNNSNSNATQSSEDNSPKSNVHNHPNCKCDVESARKVDQPNSPKRKAPTPPVRKPSTRLCSTEPTKTGPVDTSTVQLKNNLTSECVV